MFGTVFIGKVIQGVLAAILSENCQKGNRFLYIPRERGSMMEHKELWGQTTLDSDPLWIFEKTLGYSYNFCLHFGAQETCLSPQDEAKTRTHASVWSLHSYAQCYPTFLTVQTVRPKA